MLGTSWLLDDKAKYLEILIKILSHVHCWFFYYGSVMNLAEKDNNKRLLSFL